MIVQLACTHVAMSVINFSFVHMQVISESEHVEAKVVVAIQ